MNKQKIIVTDCDGVLLNWEFAFGIWMEEHGHTPVDGSEYMYNIGDRYGINKAQGKQLIKLFNESAAIGFLPALRDAQYYVKLLVEKHGYQFDVVTSLSTNRYAQKLRKRNLEKLFGTNAFRKIKCLPTGADKDEYLHKHYNNTGHFWLEDKPENAVAGQKVGLKPIIIEHGHNMDYTGDIPVIKNWEEFYNMVTSSD